ncbi:MAG TPA: cysteine desulfurase family protein [Candidatus Paceibacterota bacterium]|nr:cysteine desulfurase family protein [Candidatus Paceibacterota bacterium]HMO83140.1 cysteine desulfurase family protein [Candidatus Paceibacterota bacterium]
MFFNTWFKGRSKRIYLDHAAATPMLPLVKKAMEPFLTDYFANPSAIHQEGQFAKKAVMKARQEIATILGVRPSGVTFTSGGTESNNLAIMGLVKRLHREEGIPYNQMEILTTRLEHPSVLAVLPILANTGVKVNFVEVDSEGKITLPALKAALTSKTFLVTFAYANSEIGVVQPVQRLVREIRRFEKNLSHKIIVHLDAAQAPLWLPCKLPDLGADLMSLDVAKCGGPKGLGLLVSHGDVPLLPILYGGGQEEGLRPGTENVAAIVGSAVALRLAQATYKSRAEKVIGLRDNFFTLLPKALPNSIINGPLGDSRLANNINFSLPGFDTEYAVVYLDKHGIAASTKSACAGAGGGNSTVVQVISSDTKRASSTIRLTLNEETKEQDLKTVLSLLQKYQKLMSNLTP